MGFKVITISAAALVFIAAFVLVLDYTQHDKITNTTKTFQVKNTNVSTNIDLPKYSGPLPDDELCEYNEIGYNCRLVDAETYVGNYIEDSEMFGQVNEDFKKYCEETGGTWGCYGFCLPDYEHYCDPKFTDAGRTCYDSSQCQGECVVGMEYIAVNYSSGIGDGGLNVGPNFTGTCAELPLRECDRWYELNNGIIENHATIICD